MRIAHKPTKLLVTGRSGTGKTTFILRYLAGAIAEKVFIYDHQSEFSERLGLEPLPLTLAALGEHADRHRVTICDPSLTRTPAALGFELFCQFCREYAQLLPAPCSTLLVCDELHRLQETTATGLPESFVDVLEFGRRDGLDVLIASQAPNLLHNRIRNQITEVAAFSLIDERAASWLEPVGVDADDLRRLPRGQYIYINLDTGDQRRGVVF